LNWIVVPSPELPVSVTLHFSRRDVCSTVVCPDTRLACWFDKTGIAERI
jgi:hypothetical protein